VNSTIELLAEFCGRVWPIAARHLAGFFGALTTAIDESGH
jgi:hypothetical protein